VSAEILADLARESAHFAASPAGEPARPEPEQQTGRLSVKQWRDLRTAADKVAELLAESPEAALLVYDALATRIRRATFPQPDPVLISEDEGAYERIEWPCPHCGNDLAEVDGMRAVDVATRWTKNGGIAVYPHSTQVHFDYSDSDADFNGLHYACEACDRPVSLPAGASE
jgi:hypothetical protein